MARQKNKQKNSPLLYSLLEKGQNIGRGWLISEIYIRSFIWGHHTIHPANEQPSTWLYIHMVVFPINCMVTADTAALWPSY
jgi:hypothetical protein